MLALHSTNEVHNTKEYIIPKLYTIISVYSVHINQFTQFRIFFWSCHRHVISSMTKLFLGKDTLLSASNSCYIILHQKNFVKNPYRIPLQIFVLMLFNNL